MAEPTLVDAPTKGPTIPSGKGEIRVTPTAPTQPATAPPPGSAKEKLMARLAKSAGVEPSTLAPQQPYRPPPPPTNGQPEAGKRADPSKPLDPVNPQGEPARKEIKGAPTVDDKGQPTQPAKPEDAPDLSDEEIAAKAADKTNKTNPWKLVQEYKKRIKTIQTEHENTRKLIADEPARKAEVERLTKAEARAKELEDHIRYVDYSKSQEFKEKYSVPYERAWETAMGELQGLDSINAEGEPTKFNPQDMLELVRMPLALARNLAEEKWGPYADDVMAQRKEIRGLYDQQARALEDARTKGAERETQTRAEMERVNADINKEVKTHWQSHNDAMLADEKVGRYLKPVEGDDEVNQRLETGFTMVDKAFALNPMDHKMNAAQREEAIKMHVAVRNRAAAFGSMRLRLERAEAKIKEQDTELSQYRGTTPELGGRASGATMPEGGDFKSRMTQKLMAKAR